jgi:hypothetical protein
VVDIDLACAKPDAFVLCFRFSILNLSAHGLNAACYPYPFRLVPFAELDHWQGTHPLGSGVRGIT